MTYECVHKHDKIETRIADLQARVIYGPRNVVAVVFEHSGVRWESRRRILDLRARRVWVMVSRGIR